MSATTSSDASIAPAWHAAVVLIVLLGISFAGTRADLPAVLGVHGRVPRYLFVVVMEWAIVAFIWWGLNRRGVRVSVLVGGRWDRGINVLRDIGIGIAFILISGGAIQGLAYLLHAVPPQGMRDMMPQTLAEMIAWVPLSLTGGFCEELIFRGYLQRQFTAFTHSLAGGIVVQAVAFGLGHGYQGWKLMSLITIYGACFGLLAHWRRSLRPGMIGHALQDVAGGLLARYMG
jgi:uncharacterized protein